MVIFYGTNCYKWKLYIIMLIHFRLKYIFTMKYFSCHTNTAVNTFFLSNSRKSFITVSSGSYRNVMQGANLVNYEKRPRSITRSDFQPKALYPFSESSTEVSKCLCSPKHSLLCHSLLNLFSFSLTFHTQKNIMIF